jgi:hypothetical protein
MRIRARAALAVLAAMAAMTTLAALGTVRPASAKDVEGAATVAAFDRSATFRSVVDDGRTSVQRLPDRETVLTLDEPLQLRAVEAGGSRIALATPLAPGADAYRPGGRTTTRLVVADLAAGTTRTFDVPRNIEPEAFGVGIGGREQLFVVDHRPAEDPSSYRVGAVDLTDGRFGGLIGPNKTPLDIDMTGVARKQVLSRSGQQLYTLYLRHEHSGGVRDGHGASETPAVRGVAFVHVLDLAGVWAYCVDLPGVGHGDARASSIRLSDDGATLVVTDRHAGKRVAIPTAALSVDRLASGSPELTVTRTRSGSRQ